MPLNFHAAKTWNLLLLYKEISLLFTELILKDSRNYNDKNWNQR